MEVTIAILGAVLPALLLVAYFIHHDRRPEPRHVTAVTFALGVVLVVPLYLLGMVVANLREGFDNIMLEAFFLAFGLAAIPEELLKCGVLLGYSTRHRHYDEPMDAVVYGATTALGFAALENVIYVVGANWTVVGARALTTVPMHACLGAILGYYVGRAHFVKNNPWLVWRGLLLVIMVHGLYDFPLLALRAEGLRLRQGQPSALAPWMQWVLLAIPFAMLAVAGRWTYRIVRHLRKTQEHTVEPSAVSDQTPKSVTIPVR